MKVYSKSSVKLEHEAENAIQFVAFDVPHL